jgi:hypothetical protein
VRPATIDMGIEVVTTNLIERGVEVSDLRDPLVRGNERKEVEK